MAYGVDAETMTEAQCKSVFTDAMRWHLRRILADTPLDGSFMAEHLYANEIFEVINTLLANKIPREKLSEEFAQEAVVRNWPKDAYAWGLQEFNRIIANPDVGEEQWKSYVTAFGIKPTTTNEERMIEEIRRGRAAAFVEVNKQLRAGLLSRRPWAEEAMANPSSDFAFEKTQEREKSEAEPTVTSGTTMAGPRTAPEAPSPAPEADIQTSTAPEACVSEACRSSSPPEVAAASPHGPAVAKAASETTPISDADFSTKRITAEAIMKITVVRKKIGDAKEESNGWDDKSQAQALQSARLFDLLIDKCVKDLSLADFDDFCTMLKSIPNPYMLSRQDHVIYLRVMANHYRCEKSIPKADFGKTVGLSNVTIRRHLTFLNAMLAMAKTRGVLKSAIDLRDIRSTLPAGNRQKSGKPNPATDVQKLFSLPIFTGSQPHEGGIGAVQIRLRTTPGEFLCHDAWYFGPLLLHYTGMRRQEVFKLAPVDIIDSHPIPHISVDFTEQGRVKSAFSVRLVPLHPELIRLGFLDFVRRCREEGWTELFPDLDRGKGPIDYGDAFYDRVWSNIKKVGEFSTTFRPHGERHGFTTELHHNKVGLEERARLNGHSTGMITADVYTDYSELPSVNESLAKLPSATSHLRPVTIQLNPTILREAAKKLEKQRSGHAPPHT